MLLSYSSFSLLGQTDFIIRLRYAFCGCICCVLFVVAAAKGQDSVNKTELAEIKKIMQSNWNTMVFLDLVYKVRNVQSNEGSGYLEESIKIGPLGRRALTLKSVKPSRTPLVLYSVRYDGKKTYSTLPFPEHPGSVAAININNQPPNNAYVDSMTGLLWLVIPSGFPPFELIDRTASASTTIGTDVMLSVTSPKHYICTLSKSHAYAVRSIKFANAIEFNVVDFKNLNGFYVPSRGNYTAMSENGVERMEFSLISGSINDPIDDSEFGMQTTTGGEFVSDGTVGDQKKRSYLVGGVAARKKLQARYPAKNTVEALVPTQVTSGTGGFSLVTFIGIASLGSIVVAGVVYWARSRAN